MIFLLAWFVWSVAAAMTMEYLVHKYAMHRPVRFFHWAFREHAIFHHAHGRNDLNVDLPTWHLLIGFAPVLLLLSVFSPVGLIALLSVILVQSVLWTHLHRATHGQGSVWILRLPGFNFLRWHHVEHHRRPGKNFGALFAPVADILFGTYSPPMVRQGRSTGGLDTFATLVLFVAPAAYTLAGWGR